MYDIWIEVLFSFKIQEKFFFLNQKFEYHFTGRKKCDAVYIP